jgi:hypothetical protein
LFLAAEAAAVLVIMGWDVVGEIHSTFRGNSGSRHGGYGCPDWPLPLGSYPELPSALD